MKSSLSALIFSIAIIIAAVLLGGAWKKSHPTRESINVTGLANQDFTSDLIVWNGSFEAKEMDLKEAYARVKRDADIVRQYLTSKGASQSEMVFGAISIRKSTRMVMDNNGNRQQEIFDGYELSQTVRIESRDVDKIEQISREVTELINQGLEFYSQPPFYYYTKLADLKIKLLAAATADARNRAEKIAENAHASLGHLLNGSMGVFQITGQNSNEEFSGGGNFNTSSKAKTASITAHLEFAVD
jgi:hypothetical protein